jgi:outer membrane biosynthesis protein TonB
MDAMRKCLGNLVTSWGLNPTEQADLIDPPAPKGSPATWVTSADYPSEMLRRRQQAYVHFRLLIDEKGVPTNCVVQSIIGQSEAGKLICEAVQKRAKFEPARNALKQPVASYYVGAVRWVIRR